MLDIFLMGKKVKIFSMSVKNFFQVKAERLCYTSQVAVIILEKTSRLQEECETLPTQMISDQRPAPRFTD